MININEIVVTPEQQYLLIHKTGCTSVVKGLRSRFGEEVPYMVERPVDSIHPLWTTVRDPYSRFISGLVYDIRSYLGEAILDSASTLESFLVRYFKASQYLSPWVHPELRKVGRAPHSIPQAYYLQGTRIDTVVRMEDLSLFNQVHFGEDIKDNIGSNADKDLLEQVLNSLPDLKREILSLLEVDRHLLDSLSREGKVWRWTDGAIF